MSPGGSVLDGQPIQYPIQPIQVDQSNRVIQTDKMGLLQAESIWTDPGGWVFLVPGIGPACVTSGDTVMSEEGSCVVAGRSRQKQVEVEGS